MSLGTITMLTHDQQIDRRILSQADTLTEAGWQVTIIAMPSNETDANDKNYSIVRLAHGDYNGKTSVIFSLYRQLKKRLGVNNPLYGWLKSLAINHFYHPEKIFLDLYLDTAKQYPADIIVAHDLPMLPVACQLANGSKIIYDCHEFYPFQDMSQKESKLWQNIEAKYIHHCNDIITVNPSLAFEIAKVYGVKKINVIENAVNPVENKILDKRFHQHFNLPPEAKIVLFQGNLSQHKNLETLVKAMALVTDEKIHLVIMGDGPHKKCLLKLQYQSGVTERIHFHPAVPQQQLISYTQAADVGIIPYQGTCLNNQYCSPNKLYEFIAAGLPILATDLPELRRIVIGEKIGLVGETRAPAEVATLIHSYFADQSLAKKFTKQLTQIQSDYSWSAQEEKLRKIFAQT